MIKFFAFAYLVISFSILPLNAQPHILPVAGAGSCTAGTTYKINSIDSLKANIANLECIFSAALAPDAIGLGFNYGTVLLGENSLAVQPFASPLYQGDYVVRTTCKQRTVFMGTLKVAGMTIGTAPWTLAPFAEKVAAGEAPISAAVNNIIMDFRQNVHDICPVEDLNGMLNSKGFLPFKNPLLPVNCFVDIARVVGRDASDGGIILLAKGMNKDPAEGWHTSLFYALKNFDPAVKPGVTIGTTLIVPTSFDYIHNGFIETFSRFGGTGLIPFLINAKRSILTALTSNPFIAALALKANELGPLEGMGMSPFPFMGVEEQLLRGISRNSWLEGLAPNKLLEGIQSATQLLTQESVTPLDETTAATRMQAFWDGLATANDDDNSDDTFLYRGLQQYFDLMKMIALLEKSQVSRFTSSTTDDIIANHLRSSNAEGV